jgi:hypothetical protein
VVTRVTHHPIDIGNSKRACRVDVWGAGGVRGLQMDLSPVQTIWRLASELADEIIYESGKSQMCEWTKEEDTNRVKVAYSGVPRHLGIFPFQRAFPHKGGGGNFPDLEMCTRILLEAIPLI